MPGERVAEGNAFDTGNNPFLIAAPATIADNADPDNFYAKVFDAGVPAPTGGATYGIGVLSTPNAVVADQSVNPLMQLSFEEVLTNDATRQLLIQAGITAVDDFEWLKGPTRPRVARFLMERSSPTCQTGRNSPTIPMEPR